MCLRGHGAGAADIVDVKADSSGLLYYIHYHDCELCSCGGLRLLALLAGCCWRLLLCLCLPMFVCTALCTAL